MNYNGLFLILASFVVNTTDFCIFWGYTQNSNHRCILPKQTGGTPDAATKFD
jgi:hypothetical protein